VEYTPKNWVKSDGFNFSKNNQLPINVLFSKKILYITQRSSLGINAQEVNKVTYSLMENQELTLNRG
jgi:hypothetical protein